MTNSPLFILAMNLMKNNTPPITEIILCDYKSYSNNELNQKLLFSYF